LRTRLAAAYADPAAAHAAWLTLARDQGLAGATAAVTRDPAALGPLKGRRILFGLLANRDRADALASARLIPEDGADAWNTAIRRDIDKAATHQLDRLDAGPELTQRRDAIAELGPHRAANLRSQAQSLRQEADIADLQAAVRQARQIGPRVDRAGTLACLWADNLAGPERARIEGIAAANQQRFQGLLADAFKLREPIAFAAWSLSIARSLSRGIDRSM